MRKDPNLYRPGDEVRYRWGDLKYPDAIYIVAGWHEGFCAYVLFKEGIPSSRYVVVPEVIEHAANSELERALQTHFRKKD